MSTLKAASALLNLTNVILESTLQAQRVSQLIQKVQLEGRDILPEEWAELDKDFMTALERLKQASG